MTAQATVVPQDQVNVLRALGFLPGSRLDSDDGRPPLIDSRSLSDPARSYDDPVAVLGAVLLRLLGEDPDREGLKETPVRWAAWWREFMGYEDENMDTTFKAVHTDQMVVVSGIRVWSLCEHHLLPFWCDVAIGYMAKDRVLGLSKLARIARHAAHRLQLQERLVDQIADRVDKLAETPDVAVLAIGEHSCMAMRGVRSSGTMKSSVMRGRFRADHRARDEFLAMVTVG